MKARPTVANVSMTTANTEYSYELPQHTKEFFIKLRNLGYPLQLAVVEGDSNTTYYNIANSKTLRDEVRASKVTLYFRSTTNSMVAEILSWV